MSSSAPGRSRTSAVVVALLLVVIAAAAASIWIVSRGGDDADDHDAAETAVQGRGESPALAPGRGRSATESGRSETARARRGRQGDTPQRASSPDDRRGDAPAHSTASGAQRPGAGAAADDEGDEEAEAGDSLDRLRHLSFSVDREGIQQAVREVIPEVQQCYEAWLAVSPDLAGRIVVSFTVSPTDDPEPEGRVTSVDVAESSMGHEVMEGCLLATLSRLPFDEPPDGEVTVNYPFNFSSGDEDDE